MEDFDDSAMDTDNESVDMSNDSFDTDSSDFDDIPDVSDDSGSDFDDIPEGVDDFGSDFDEIPEGSDDSESDISDVPDDSEMSISELYEQGQREMLEAQQEAEDWADENGMTEWSDGTPRQEVADEAMDEMSVDSSENVSEPSIAELYEQGQREMLEAQQEAEDWVDAHDVNAWSDGSMREGHENDDYFRSSLDADQTEMDGLQEQTDYYNNHK